MTDDCLQSSCSCHEPTPIRLCKTDIKGGEITHAEILPEPQTWDWKSDLIPEFSSVAVRNEDRVDGYEMETAVAFIEKVLASHKQTLKQRVGEMNVMGIGGGFGKGFEAGFLKAKSDIERIIGEV